MHNLICKSDENSLISEQFCFRQQRRSLSSLLQQLAYSVALDTWIYFENAMSCSRCFIRKNRESIKYNSLGWKANPLISTHFWMIKWLDYLSSDLLLDCIIKEI